jgi:hypothetical protein
MTLCICLHFRDAQDVQTRAQAERQTQLYLQLPGDLGTSTWISPPDFDIAHRPHFRARFALRNARSRACASDRTVLPTLISPV